MALRDAWRLSRALTEVQQGTSALLPALQAYEAEMRVYGYDAVRAALGYTQQAVTTKRMVRLGSRTWFRLCRAIPSLKRVFEDQWTKPMRNQLKTANAR